jgi:glycosyltransferase involved in cell wall biosynthesis
VLHIESGRHLYGGARQVAYLIEGLAARGVENVLVCHSDQPLAGMRLPAAVHAMPIGGDLDLGLAGRLRRAVLKFRPDVVHVHSRRGVDVHGGRASRALGVPAVLTRRVDSPEAVAWVRYKYRAYARVIGISSAVTRELVDRVGLDAGRVRLIPSAVDSRLYRPDTHARARLDTELGVAPDAFAIGVVAQLIPRKGHEHLFACLPEVVARHPSITVLCFGRGPEKRRLERAIARGGLERHVKLVGFHDALERLMPGLDLLVHPAEREGLGLALLEAMSSGVAVVATAVGGIVDVVENETTGLLAPARSRSALAAAIARLVTNDRERRALAEAGRARVLERFTIDAMIDSHLEVYADVAR